MTDVQLQQALAVVCEMCGRTLSVDGLTQTAEELRGYPDAAVLSAMRHVTREAGAWKYGDSLLSALLAYMHGTREEAASMAWGAVMSSLERRDLDVVYSDPAAAEAVRMCGGRTWLSSMDSHTLAQVRRDFTVYYRECSMKIDGKTVPAPEGATIIECGTHCGRVQRGWPVCLELPSGASHQLQITSARPEAAPESPQGESS